MNVDGLTGVNEALVSMKKVDTELKTGISKNVEKMAEQIANEAVLRVPIDTGELCGTIRFQKIDDQTAEIYAGYPKDEGEYAAFVEFGTWKMDAQPYMRPAVDFVVKTFGFSGYLQTLVNRAIQ
jgi:HK97 gp10 family phage protein